MASAHIDVEVTQCAESREGIPKGAKTSDYYRTKEIPQRFEYPEWFQGYGGKTQHPMYRTSSQVYGSKAPSVHTMPRAFHARSQNFTADLGKCGMYRNHSLNTGEDKSKVPN